MSRWPSERGWAQIERKGTAIPEILYIHADRLGSTQLITNGEATPSSAFVVHEQTFDPWGKPEGTATWDSQANPRVRNVHAGFTGHEHDPEHGLVNMGGRIYDPELGQFTTADPIVQAASFSQSYNRYAYALNNPVSLVDPSGFLPCTPGFCQSMVNFFNTSDSYFERGQLRDSEHDPRPWLPREVGQRNEPRTEGRRTRQRVAAGVLWSVRNEVWRLGRAREPTYGRGKAHGRALRTALRPDRLQVGKG